MIELEHYKVILTDEYIDHLAELYLTQDVREGTFQEFVVSHLEKINYHRS